MSTARTTNAWERQLLQSCLGASIYDVLAMRCRRAHGRRPGPLSLHEAIVVRAYTDKKLGYYQALNLNLRLNNASAEQREFSRLLDRAMSKLPVYDGVVFRGVSLGPAQLAAVGQKYETGTVFGWRGFSSASILLSRVYGANVYFALRSANGRVLGRYSAAPSEQEVLFRRNSRFEVLSRRCVSSSLWFVDVEEVPNAA